jgi:hypothetical protein
LHRLEARTSYLQLFFFGLAFLTKALPNLPRLGGGLILSIARYITKRKHADEALRPDDQRMEAPLHLNQMAHASFQEITSFAMEVAMRLTKSRIGYHT